MKITKLKSFILLKCGVTCKRKTTTYSDKNNLYQFDSS